jgi:cobalt/nickel transport system permease protein/cobalt/nickel transport protein
VASYYASSHPDGLGYVAEQVGFADSAEDSAAADSPLADYQVRGVENDALSGGLAGVAGALLVLVLVAGLTYLVRRKGAAVDESAAATDPTSDARTAASDPASDQTPAERQD